MTDFYLFANYLVKVRTFALLNKNITLIKQYMMRIIVTSLNYFIS